MDAHELLRRRWKRLWKEMEIRDHDRLLDANFAELMKLYRGRPYHNERHILSGLIEIDKVARYADDVDALELGFYYHDSIYDVYATNNEEESGRLMLRHTAELPIPDSFRRKTYRRVIATRHTAGIILVDPDDQLIADVDLTILGSNPHEYEAYARAIREEYGHLSASVFNKGRARVMNGILSHECHDGAWIYYTPRFRKRYEHRARQNISRELARLEAAI